MPIYEYKVVPAPRRGVKVKGVKGTEALFAAALTEVLNAEGAQGWDYLRTDTLPCEERQGLTGRATHYQNMLVFRRATDSTAGTQAPQESFTPATDANPVAPAPAIAAPAIAAPAIAAPAIAVPAAAPAHVAPAPPMPTGAELGASPTDRPPVTPPLVATPSQAPAERRAPNLFEDEPPTDRPPEGPPASPALRAERRGDSS